MARLSATTILSKLVFAALPLLINAIVWSVLKAVAWPFFRVDDLTYFTLTFAAESLLVAFLFNPFSNEWARAVPFILSMVALIGSCVVFGFWRRETAYPRANTLVYPEVHALVLKTAACASVALIAGSTILWQSWGESRGLPSHPLSFAGRLIIAALPCGLDALASSSAITWSDFHTSDICFFSIAISGSAILDIAHGTNALNNLRRLFLLSLVIVIAWSSLLLGFWYFETALPHAASSMPAGLIQIMWVNAVWCASLAFGLALASIVA